jgi:hypothetical protein
VDRWITPLKRATREEIYRTVDDRGWQEFRLSLKGLPTEIKLDRLWNYLYNNPPSMTNSQELDSAFYDRSVRVANYLAALRRGGQLNMNNEVVR